MPVLRPLASVRQPNSWWVDELNLSTYAWNVSVASIEAPERRGEHLVVPGRSGVVPALDRPASAPEFAVSVWALGCNADGTIPPTMTARRSVFESNLDTLMRVLTVDTRPLQFLRVNASGTTGRMCRASLTGSIPVTTMAGRTRAEFTATYSVIDGYWSDEAPSVITAAVPALPYTVALNALGGMTAPAEDAVFEVRGPITNPKITDLETGAWVSYTGVLTSADIWVVDAGSFSSLVNGWPQVSKTRHAGSPRLLTLSPRYGFGAPPTVELSGSGRGVSTRLTVTARRKWQVP